MRSLSTHLRQPEDHARLPFHPDCPNCRSSERLIGAVPSEGIVSLRAQAAFAAGVLALSAVAPASAAAVEPDQVRDGAVAPEQVEKTDPANSPDFDPGGVSTELPADAPSVPQAQAPPAQAPPASDDDDVAPLDQEPTEDVDAPIVDAGDTPAESIAGPQPQASPGPASPPAEPASSPDMGPYAVATPPGGAPTPAAPVNETATGPDAVAPPASTAAPDKEAVYVGAVRKAPRRRGVAKPKVAERKVVREAAQADPPQVAAPDGPSDASRGLEVVRASPPSTGGASAEVGDVSGRVHVVRSGESLWSIAKQVLGGGQASTARVAREVNRLWELNQDRIGTGDPDLLMVDTKLRLR